MSGIEPRASHRQAKHFSAEPIPWPKGRCFDRLRGEGLPGDMQYVRQDGVFMVGRQKMEREGKVAEL